MGERERETDRQRVTEREREREKERERGGERGREDHLLVHHHDHHHNHDHLHQLRMRTLPARGAAKPRKPPWSASVSHSQSRIGDRLVAGINKLHPFSTKASCFAEAENLPSDALRLVLRQARQGIVHSFTHVGAWTTVVNSAC